MKTYQYNGRDRHGKFVSGTVDAVSIDSAMVTLQEQKIGVIDIVPAKARRQFWAKLVDKTSLFWRPARRHFDTLNLYMASLIRTGMPVYEAVKHASENITSWRLRLVLRQVAEKMRSGETLQQAMEHFPCSFPLLYRNMLSFGERSGQLEHVLSNLNEMQSKRSKFFFSVFMSLGTCIILASILTILNYWIGTRLDLLVIYIQLISEEDLNPLIYGHYMFWKRMIEFDWYYYWQYFALGAVFLVSFRIRFTRIFYQAILIRIPYIRHLLRMSMVMQFAFLMAGLLRCGVPFEKAISFASRFVDNYILRRRVQTIAKTLLQKGATPYDAFSYVKLFSSGELYLLRVGFDSGGLEEIFQRIYDLNDELLQGFRFVMITAIRLCCYVGIIYYSYYVFELIFVGLKIVYG